MYAADYEKEQRNFKLDTAAAAAAAARNKEFWSNCCCPDGPATLFTWSSSSVLFLLDVSVVVGVCAATNACGIVAAEGGPIDTFAAAAAACDIAARFWNAINWAACICWRGKSQCSAKKPCKNNTYT